MRIRRHARNSAADHTASSLAPGTVLQTYACQLNQSPWDVMSFSPPSSPPPPPSPQVNGADVRNSDRGNSLIESQNMVSDRKIKDDGCKKVKEQLPKGKTGKIILCVKNDGKSWHCRREAAQDSSFCEHHLSLSRNYHYSALTNNAAKKFSESATTAAVEPRRSSRSSNKLENSASDSNEFYFYSGFRPGWSKKGMSNAANNNGRNTRAGIPRINATSNDGSDKPAGFPRNDERDQSGNGDRHEEVAREDGHEVDSGEHEEEDEEEEIGGSGKKRVRKPIKARSLKSLM